MGKDKENIILFIGSFILAGLFIPYIAVLAQATPNYETIPQPYISIAPDTFYTLEDVLYIQGRSDPNAFVIVTVEKQGEEQMQFSTTADSLGEWVVAEDVYLSSGNWEVRAKQRVGQFFSRESNVRVIRSVVTGTSVFGFQVRYAVLTFILIGFFAILIFMYIYFRAKIQRLKRGLVKQEIHETETRFQKGFVQIRKDIMEQLQQLASNTQGRQLMPDEIEKKNQLFRELEDLEKNLEHDLGDIERRY